jgi:hypothetical protein
MRADPATYAPVGSARCIEMRQIDAVRPFYLIDLTEELTNYRAKSPGLHARNRIVPNVARCRRTGRKWYVGMTRL